MDRGSWDGIVRGLSPDSVVGAVSLMGAMDLLHVVH